ncbi:protein ROOT HAIR DEFECTIVE 3-like [Triticum dicoccoides]|uniref:protein ROOT HAIR DEFECTIVE 3-like n=1 Tax=Triticum dicoccoides TaxID=85692 RepID=UPI00188F8C32|nr:protein ROOT HAIR DEFECTIVE 3-like [Triticum dicoccoides]
MRCRQPAVRTLPRRRARRTLPARLPSNGRRPLPAHLPVDRGRILPTRLPSDELASPFPPPAAAARRPSLPPLPRTPSPPRAAIPSPSAVRRHSKPRRPAPVTPRLAQHPTDRTSRRPNPATLPSFVFFLAETRDSHPSSGVLVDPAYQYLMGHLVNETLKAFKESLHEAQKNQEFHVAACDCAQSFLHKFRKGCEDATIQQVKWDPANFMNKLKHAMDDHVVSVHALKTKLADICGRYEGRLTRALAEPVKEFLLSAPYNTWAVIKMLLASETKVAVANLKLALLDLEAHEDTVKERLSKLENHGRSVVESKSKEEAATISVRMIDRFRKLFSACMSREKKGKINVQAIVESALNECMMMLWIVSAIQLDGDGETFKIFRSLLNKLPEGDEGPRTIDDPLELILKAGTLISPEVCKLIWCKFMVEVDPIVTAALDAEKAHKWKKRMSRIHIGLIVLNVAASTAVFVTTGVVIPIF